MKQKRYGNVTPEFLMQQAEPIEFLYQSIEDQILLNIARIFKGSPDDWEIPSLQWQARKLAQIGGLNSQNIQIISKYIGDESTLTALALEKTLRKAIQSVDPELAAAMKQGFLSGNPSDIETAVQSQLSTYLQQAVDRQNLVNTVMLNSSLSQARKVVANTLVYERQLEAAQKTLNARAGEVVTGVSTRQQALRRAVIDMAQNGLTGFTDRAGRNWSPEAYVSMDIRTTAHNVAHQAVFNRCDEYGCNLVEVSSHAGARPLCEPYQGGIFDRNDGSGFIKDGSGKLLPYRPWSSTSFGEPAGLLGINCGHMVYPFIPGFSTKSFDQTRSKKDNDEQYQQSQRQRKIERTIRNYKRSEALLRAAGDEEGAKKEHEKVLNAQAAMRTFIEETGRTRRRDREQVYGI